jgi:PAS domain S-box-containing protein
MAVLFFPVQTKRGEQENRWYSAINSPMFNDNDHLDFIVHRAEDVTPFVDQKRLTNKLDEAFTLLEDRNTFIETDIMLRSKELHQANVQLRKSELELRIALEAAEMGTWHWDLINNDITWNRRHFLLFGMSLKKTTVTPDEFFARIHPDHREELRKKVYQTIDNGVVLDAEFKIIRDDGVVRWISGYGQVVDRKENRPAAISGVMFDITDSKQTAIALQTSKEQLQSLVDNAPIGIYVVDQDFIIRKVNAVAAKVFEGIDNVVGGDFDEIIHKLWSREYADELVTLFRDTLETGNAHVNAERIEMRIDRGVIEYYEWQINRIPLTDGRNGVVCYFRDISAAVSARKKISDSEERYRALFNTMEEAYYVIEILFDADSIPVNFRIIETNPAFERLTGLKDVINKTIGEAVPGIEEGWIKHFGEIALTGAGRRFGGPVAGLNNRWYEGYAFRLGKEDNNTVAIVFSEITDRKKTEEDLRESEERFRTLTDVVPQIIWTSDPDGKATYFNRRWFEYTGLSPEESVGPGWQAIVHPDDKESSTDRWNNALTEGEVFDAEYRLRRLDGEYRWHIGRIVPLHDKEGKVISWFGTATDVQDLKHTEELLRASEERLRLTMESATDYAIITLDTHNIIEGWSNGAQHIFGYTEAEAIGQSGAIIFTPEDRAINAPQQEIDTACTEGRAKDERWHMRANGSRFYMSGVMSPIRDDKGTVTGYVKVARDMTDDQLSAERLRQSEERHRIVLEAAEFGAWDWDIVTDKIIWSDRFYELMGLIPDNKPKTYQEFMSLIHPEDLERMRDPVPPSGEQSMLYQAEFRITRANDKSVRWMNGYGKTIDYDDTGRATRMTGVIFDITGRKEAESALVRAQEQLKLALSASAIGIWIHDLGTNRMEWTREQELLFGLEPGTFKGNFDEWKHCVHADDLPKLLEDYNVAAINKQHFEAEYRIVCPTDVVRWMLAKSKTYASANGTPEYTMGATIDITERKQLEQQKEEFIGIASHELKTPVTSIKAYTEILEHRFRNEGDEPSVALMTKLARQVDRLATLIHQLLDVTKVTGGQLNLDPERFDLNLLIEERLEELRATTIIHDFIFNPGDIPPIVADRDRIGQVLVNLVGNAIKYSPHGGKIIISSQVRNDHKVEVAVQDYGIGMEPAMLGRIFERFFRANNVNASLYPGLGLGLYISSEIIKRHKGTFNVKSAKEEGSTFSFTLPLGDDY